jgi:hypothetical protein
MKDYSVNSLSFCPSREFYTLIYMGITKETPPQSPKTGPHQREENREPETPSFSTLKPGNFTFTFMQVFPTLLTVGTPAKVPRPHLGQVVVRSTIKPPIPFSSG